jgi:hypothetical protein
MSINQTKPANLHSFLILAIVVGLSVLAWVFTPLSSWILPQKKPIIAQPTQPQPSLLFDEQTKLPINHYPPKLQGLEQQWRMHLKKAIDKGLFGEDISFNISNLAHKQWMMQTQQAIYFEDNSGGAFLKAVEGTLLNPQGQVVGQFKAPYGTYNAKTQIIHLQGGIQFQGLTGR